jgi:hypothetical protein
MRIFGRQREESAESRPMAVGERELRDAVAGMANRRRARAKSFSVLTLVPQLIAGERLRRAEHALVAECLDRELRSGDAYSQVDDDSYVIVLQGTTDDYAPAVAHRVAQELITRSQAVRRRNWHVGVASYPRDAQTEQALMEIARKAALAQGKATRIKRAS